jgi:hypothetical protein
MTLTLPQNEIIERRALPPDINAEVDAWLLAFAEVRRPIVASLKMLARQMGHAEQTVIRRWYAFQKYGWRGLVNRARVPGWHPEHGLLARDSAAISEEFVEWFRALAESNQRKTRPAYREFMRRWMRGEIIPGLDNEQPRHRMPAGCSYGNLARKCRDRFALTAMRIGLGAARKFAPQTFSTRAGLWVGSHYMFDDVWHDNFVVYRGQVVRVLEFGALDVFSACRFAWGTQPRLRNADGTEEGLKEKFMRMHLADVLWNHGYSERGTTLLAEHGTAAIRERLEQLLHDRTGGLITVRRSGITGREQAVAGMALGRGGGNPSFKASLESLHNLIHNELAAIPGQTGLDVEHRPERLHGELKHATDLLKAIQKLQLTRPERVALIRLPVLEYHAEFLPLLADIYAQINGRDWHELEGWDQCGHFAIDYRLAPDTDQWITREEFLSLPETTRELLTMTAAADTRFLRQRKLSPAEVHARQRRELRRIPEYVVAEILGMDFAREQRVDGSYFEFTDATISAEELRYESRIRTPEGREVELPDRERYQVFVNPLAPDALFVHDAKGVHLGIARRVQRVCRADLPALQAAQGRSKQRLADKLAPVRARHAGMTQTAIEHNRINDRLLDAGRAVTTEERDRARALRRFDGDADELVGAPASGPAAAAPDDSDFSADDLI